MYHHKPSKSHKLPKCSGVRPKLPGKLRTPFAWINLFLIAMTLVGCFYFLLDPYTDNALKTSAFLTIHKIVSFLIALF